MSSEGEGEVEKRVAYGIQPTDEHAPSAVTEVVFFVVGIVWRSSKTLATPMTGAVSCIRKHNQSNERYHKP
jgi:hypothetical protein